MSSCAGSGSVIIMTGKLTRGVIAMREQFVYALLLTIKYFSKSCYRFDISWIGQAPEFPWKKLRLVTFLNHTSLYEPLFVGWFPNQFLKRIARLGVIPIADKALRRPIMGYFFRMVANNVVPVTRKRDQTWNRFIEHLKPDSMVIIMPEGRMKRANGLDNTGNPMTVRGGIADIIEAIPSGRMMLAFSAGLHHVQTPGQRIPRIFKTIRMRLENIDIAEYRQAILDRWGRAGFNKGVVQDLEQRRDLHCRALAGRKESRVKPKTLVLQ